MRNIILIALFAALLVSDVQGQRPVVPRNGQEALLRALLLLVQQAGGELIVQDHGASVDGEIDVEYTPGQIKIAIGRKS